MNGSIVYELDRPENGGLKKPVKVTSLLLFPSNNANCNRDASDCIYYLSNLYFFEHIPRLINFYSTSDRVTSWWMRCCSDSRESKE